MKVKSLRAVRIASLSGHIINVPANIPYEIPDVLAEEAFARGCVPCDSNGDATETSSEEELAAEAAAQENLRRAAAETVDAPVDGAPVGAPVDAEVAANEKQDKLFMAFEMLVEEGAAEKFNKLTGAPRVGPVSDILSEKVSAEDVDVAWSAFSKE